MDNLIESRRELVSLAEELGYGELFKDKQSIGDMEKNIKNIKNKEDREELMEKFEQVEELYYKFSSELTGELVDEMSKE